MEIFSLVVSGLSGFIIGTLFALGFGIYMMRDF